MGGGGQRSDTKAEIAPELRPLFHNTGGNLVELQQGKGSIFPFLDQRPQRVAGLSGTQQKSLGRLSEALDGAAGPLESAPIVQAGQRYFQNSIAPGIGNQAELMGLGRSTATTNALAAAEAQTALPLLQGEQSRRDQLISTGMQAGGIERGVAQESNEADQADFLRRQALAEQALFGPMGAMPSTIGQSTKTSGGGGLFK